MAQSAGHLVTIGGYEYFTYGNMVYRAPVSNPVGPNGYRMGGRFECHMRDWAWWREHYSKIAR